jgi:hypothetical protein
MLIKYFYRYLLFITVLFLIPIIPVIIVNYIEGNLSFLNVFISNYSLYYIGLLISVSFLLAGYHNMAEKMIIQKFYEFHKMFILLFCFGLFIYSGFSSSNLYYNGVDGLLYGQAITITISIFLSIVFSFAYFLNKPFLKALVLSFYGFLILFSSIQLFLIWKMKPQELIFHYTYFSIVFLIVAIIPGVGNMIYKRKNNRC